MKHLGIISLLLVLGCPKKETESLSEIERKKKIQELMAEDEEFLDELPEDESEDLEDE